MAFSIAVDLSDHTGTVSGCYIGGEVAEQMLGISVSKGLVTTGRTTFWIVRLLGATEAVQKLRKT